MKVENWEVITDSEVQSIKQALEYSSLDRAAVKIQEYFDQLDKTKLNIAVTGASGKGKSTFINTIRGLGDEEEGSAPTGVVETTMEPTEYPYPKYPNVKLWDLPGIGTENFRADKYLEQVGFQRYDFFIIISTERFTSYDVQLAREIQKMGKHFYFARSKIDESLRAEERKKKGNYSETATLDLIRKDCVTGLQNLKVESPRVFLISNFDPEKYDFPLLQEEMEKDLPQEKRHAFLLALPGISHSVNQRKKEALQAEIWKVALLSASVAAVPLPGLGIAVDVAILVKELTKYYRAFSLDEVSLNRLADQVNMPVEDLKKVRKSVFNKEITADVALKMLTKAAGGGLMVAGHFLSGIPVLGSIPAGGAAYWSTSRMLRSCLDELAEDARLVLVTAFPAKVTEV
ncbi:interferon-inducible GTPase 5-like [Megalops cyprinoides]|uniref:interferon-inducible GTPase 5-like n=1 Tax=Megalops cyprinoides TaxID=118141 RepID=UPI001864C82A|nr:interferon-inducible GTPase 5-like [Megalops cyprinoides]